MIAVVFAFVPPGARGESVKGSLPIVWLQCVFAEDIGMPYPPEHYEALTGAEYPGVDHFWNTVLYGAVDFKGSVVVRDAFLIGSRSIYLKDGQADLARLMEDCTSEANKKVHFPSFAGIGLFFSNELDGKAYGGVYTLVLDGAENTYGAMWLPSWTPQKTAAHEVGHGMLRLPHSVTPSGKQDSPYDVMSGGFFLPSPEEGIDLTFGAIGVHPVGPHKLGWISPAQVYTPAPGSVQTIRIDHLAAPSTAEYRIAEIPVSKTLSEAISYIVEERRQEDMYDRIPHSATLIHKISTEPILIAVMGVGGVFIVPENGVKISVVSSDSTGSFISIDASTMVPSILEITSPQAGEKWMVGTVQTVRWDGGTGSHASLDISRNGGASWDILVWPPVQNTGVYTWLVSKPASERAMIRVNLGAYDGAGRFFIESNGSSEIFSISKKQRNRVRAR